MTTYKERLRHVLRESVCLVLEQDKPPPPDPPPPSGPPETTSDSEGQDQDGNSVKVIEFVIQNPDVTNLEVFTFLGIDIRIPEPVTAGTGFDIKVPFWNTISWVLSVLTQKKMIESPVIVTLIDSISDQEEHSTEVLTEILEGKAANAHGEIDTLILDLFENVDPPPKQEEEG